MFHWSKSGMCNLNFPFIVCAEYILNTVDPKSPGVLTLAAQFCFCGTGFYHQDLPAPTKLQAASATLAIQNVTYQLLTYTPMRN